MEGIQTIQALKAVQSSLPAQTTIPSDELVMLYAADGTPIAKIARDDLVKAVASVMASNSQNTFSKLLGVQANGTPMGIGASDLASVLGGMKNKGNVGTNKNVLTEITTNGLYQFGLGIINGPHGSTVDNTQWYIAAFQTHDGFYYIAQSTDLNEFYSGYSDISNNWIGWNRINDMPTFYKDYANLSALASALGAVVNVPNGSIDDVTTPGLYNIINCTGNPYGYGLTVFMEVFSFVSDNKTFIYQRVSRYGVASKDRWYWDNEWKSWGDL